MRKSKIRIILTGIFLIYDQIRSKIKQKPGLGAKPFHQDIRELVIFHDFADDCIASYPQAAASV